MPTKSSGKLITWLVTRPLIFAIVSFVLMTAGAAIAGLATRAGLTFDLGPVLVVIGFLIATAILVRMLPNDTMHQRKFIGIYNAQTLITSIGFLVPTIALLTNYNYWIGRIMRMYMMWPNLFITLTIIAAIFYLYLGGIMIAGLYAKYRRARTMGIPMWRILATAPFGFCMLWMAGYMIPDTRATEPVGAKWYARITNWIAATPTRTAAFAIIMATVANLFVDLTVAALPLIAAIIFAIWAHRVGDANMRKNIAGAYTTTAITINVALVIVACIMLAKPLM